MTAVDVVNGDARVCSEACAATACRNQAADGCSACESAVSRAGGAGEQALSVTQAAERAVVHPKTIRRAIARGRKTPRREASTRLQTTSSGGERISRGIPQSRAAR